MPIQGRLFPLEIVSLAPTPPRTARLRHEGEGADGQYYFIKTVADGQCVPANELLCSSLANDIGLAVPFFTVVTMPDGSEAFGSRREAGIVDVATWVAALLAAPPFPAGVVWQFASWFGFDLFVDNIDRHFNNFLYREHQGVFSLFGFDFSEALLNPPWPPSQDMRDPCNTLQGRRALAARGLGLDRDKAIEMLNRLAALNDDWMDVSLPAVPASWLDAAERTELARWWREDRQDRLTYIKQEVANGRYP